MSNRKTIITAYIADMHVGNTILTVDEFKEQFLEYCYKPLKALPLLDAVFFLGDFSHTKMNVNNPYNLLQIWMVNKLYKLAKKKKFAMIFLDGTKSHEDDQLDQFLHMETNEDDVYFRIVKSFEVLENVGGLGKILCLPHKYTSDKKEIEQFFDDKYDLVVGHGTIDKMKFFVQDSEHKPTKEYYYSLDTLHEIAKGPIYFGHIHPYTEFRRFKYVGSFTALERGHVGTHGMLICVQDRNNTAVFKDTRVPNLKSKTFVNIPISRNQLHDMDIEHLVKYIESNLATAGENDLVTIAIMSDGNKFSADKILIIKDAYKKDRRIKITIKVKSQQLEEREKENSNLKDRYGYLIDPNLAEEEILYRFYLDELELGNEIPKDIPIDKEIIKAAIK